MNSRIFALISCLALVSLLCYCEEANITENAAIPSDFHIKPSNLIGSWQILPDSVNGFNAENLVLTETGYALEFYLNCPPNARCRPTSLEKGDWGVKNDSLALSRNANGTVLIYHMKQFADTLTLVIGDISKTYVNYSM